MNDTNGNTVGELLTALARAAANLDSAAILTAFWYVVLVAVGVYSLYLAAVFVRNALPSIGARLRRAYGYLLGRRR